MEIETADIYLNKDDNIYNPGETIIGRIEYFFLKSLKVRGINVQFEGYSHSEFVAPEVVQRFGIKKKPIFKTILHTSDEEYFNVVYSILRNQPDEPAEIPPGKQVYHFKYTLPESIPSSFEGTHGHIRYTVKVALCWSLVENKQPDHNTKVPFIVIRNLDKSIDSCCTKPLHIRLERRCRYLGCLGKPLEVDIRAPTSGFYPKQVIPLEVNVVNKSRIRVKKLQIALRRLVVYKAVRPKNYLRTTEEIEESLQTESVPGRTSKQWNLQIRVPIIPPSKLKHCEYISLDYDIYVKCFVKWNSKLHAKKAIWISSGPQVCHCKKGPQTLKQLITSIKEIP